jgi:ABC-type branched-subunit amino acid transport system substrate-binding protein
MLAGCGSTVATSTAGGVAQGSLTQGLGTAAAPTAGGVGGPAAAGGLAAGASAPITAGGVAGAGGAAGVAGGSGSPGSTGAPGAASAPGGAALHGVGVTATTVKVGIVYQSNGDAANAALGASGVTQGDTKADAQAVVDDINAHGGVAGRKLIAVFHAYDANSADTRASQDQAACAYFVQDNHVFAVLGGGYENLAPCLSKSGVVQLDGSSLLDYDKADLAALPSYFMLGTLTQDRMMADHVSTLRRLSYFSKWDYTTGKPGVMPVKLGIMSVDVPEWERPLQKVLLPALRKAGYPVAPADIFRVHNPGSTAEDGQTVNDVQSATLKFRADNVTHLLLLDAGGSLVLLFSKDAKGQGYYPRLGLNSAGAMQALSDSGVIGNDQLNGAMGLGWAPSVDLPAAETGKYATSATKYCLKVMKDRTGQTYDSTNAAAIALGYCDMGFLLALGIDHAGPSITKDTVRAAIEGVASSFVSAGSPESFFGPGRHDQVQRGYDMVWDTACTCAKYKGQHEIPS